MSLVSLIALVFWQDLLLSSLLYFLLDVASEGISLYLLVQDILCKI